jgi:hypothetical protein
LLLALLEDLSNVIDIRFKIGLRAGLHKMATLAKLQLKNRGKIRMVLHLKEMEVDQLSQLYFSIFFRFQTAMEVPDESLDFFLENTHEQVVLVLEIKIDSSSSNSRFPGHISDGGMMISMPSKGSYGRVYNPVVLVIRFANPAHALPPFRENVMNECSFIKLILFFLLSKCQMFFRCTSK